uniref:Uncharacterized protein n=1 Tax=Laticauda laticaudata TaxID=8630 RepID=A0A8C5SVM4_LATLA
MKLSSHLLIRVLNLHFLEVSVGKAVYHVHLASQHLLIKMNLLRMRTRPKQILLINQWNSSSFLPVQTHSVCLVLITEKCDVLLLNKLIVPSLPWKYLTLGARALMTEV